MPTPASIFRAIFCCCCGLFCLLCPARAQSSLLLATPEVSPAGAIAPGAARAPRVASVSKLLSFHFPLSSRQAITVGTEVVSLSSFYVKTLGTESKPDWKFKGLPITLGYEYTLTDPGRRFVPVVGAGISYYVFSLRQRDPSVMPEDVALDSSAGLVNRAGMGLGFQATLGLRTHITRHLFVQAQGRYRYLNGLALTGGDVSEEHFPMFDFAVGFGVRL
jgi:hypothetical protein